MPVSWQMAPVSSWAISMFERMISSAWADCVAGVSAAAVIFMAARTSGGRLVEVWMINARRLPARKSIMMSDALIVTACSRRSRELFQFQAHIHGHPRPYRRQRALKFDYRFSALDRFDLAGNTGALQIQNQHQGLLTGMKALQ